MTATAKDRTMDRREPEDMDVRKASARLRSAGSAQSRRSIVAATELLGGIANATADAFQSLNLALTPDSVTKSGLTTCVYVGIREGNVRFLEDLSRTSRRVFDAFRPPEADDPAPAAPEEITQPLDYERLAKLVASEMRDPEPPTG
ncbi:MAG TPA: hypothetical protein VE953_11615 [Terriglobales bacterium]|nr:hypothetical protein [Terriglobales bacterium]